MPSNLPPLSLYVHIPWCVRKCPYCDFNSHTQQGALPESNYLKALVRDLQSDRAFANGRRLESIFFGGGTPSLFSAATIGAIVDNAERELGFSKNIEITLEANPGTAEHTHFGDLRAAGINRLSMGVQSFNNRHLQALGRIHSSQEVIDAFDQARQGGFDNINLDLMHGLPQQTLPEASADLEQAIKLAPEHLSWYQLTIEPNTVFYNKPPTIPEDETLADIQEHGEQYLSQHGYEQYEVSAYSQPQHQAQHNLNYWQFGDYLGIGAGAHSKISHYSEPQFTVERYQKIRQPEAYMHAINPSIERRIIQPEQLPLEFMMNALRLNQGTTTRTFEQRTGLATENIRSQLGGLRQQALLTKDEQRIQTTALGFRFLNSVLAQFETEQ